MSIKEDARYDFAFAAGFFCGAAAAFNQDAESFNSSNRSVARMRREARRVLKLSNNRPRNDDDS